MRLSQDTSKYNEAYEETVHVGKSNYGVLLAWVPPDLRLIAKFIVIQKCCFLLLAW